ncbi:MAG: phosphopyruvate hydratase [Candidatus Zambryskibacteria bacterium CG22_combo_CG10-13_8_21_14_all_42_17]|uniref:Enolase n=1 Tax=Candidatus Zambryskibacteria bacterium CG22_combo_CG10-13_8_21_14_all_42_17 TaxID=1975118 RepID=A0A2H0BD36_9BACT|nr:MAG: phosphopyruvate hydratase [Candidatus Zambryskibacteria bacterium CG22_combo_CG10-13_8_21_14_all_42_17]
MSVIKSLKAREIIDSRGNPTIEVKCLLESGSRALASVPSGASTGIHEAHELRDGDKSRFRGKGVLKAVANVEGEINDHLKGNELEQKELDEAMIDFDGTENKSRLGANAILGVSLAFCRAQANEKKLELFEHLAQLSNTSKYSIPLPMLNIINGGMHADSGLDIQEFMIAPVGPKAFREKLQASSEVISALKDILKENNYSTSIGDEGGFAPQLKSNEEAFEVIIKAIEKAGYSTDEIKLGIDAASSSFYEDGSYKIKIASENKTLSSAEIVDWYENLCQKYPLISIEDGLAEEDWDGFALLTKKLGERIQVVGDDLMVTNIKRIKQAKEKEAANSVLIKLNQIGTLSETIQAIQLAKEYGWKPFVSHRSGDTTDTFIADLAVGLSCDYIKSGSLARGERVCKYNRIMEIENLL